MTGTTLPVTGGCLCRAIRYEVDAPPRRGAYCHCDSCKKSYGGLYMATVQFDLDVFRFVAGIPRYYRSSDVARRGFCADCGSPLVFQFDGDTEVWVLLGSLDRPGDWPLVGEARWGEIAHTQIDRMVPWHVPVPGIVTRDSQTAKFREEALARAAHRGASSDGGAAQ